MSDTPTPEIAASYQSAGRRARLECWLHERWYDGARVPFWLAALEPLYRASAALHALPYQQGWLARSKMAVPVIVVGNLTAGGTGKTPLVIWLVEHLRKRGLRPGIICRGYLGKARGAPQMVNAQSDWREVGDEPVLLARRSQVPVAVGADRVAAAQVLSAQCDVLVCDDGLQHHRLARDLEILLVDGIRRFGNGRRLPAGPLRQSAAHFAQRFPLRVVNGAHGEPGEWPMQLLGQNLLRLDGSQAEPLANWRGRQVRALAGIGNPQRFYNALRSAGLEVRAVPVADHGIASSAQLHSDAHLPLLMTEKDALKYQIAELPDARMFPVDAHLDSRLADLVWEQLCARRRGEL